MKYHYYLRAKVRGHHLEYSHFIRCEENDVNACLLKAKKQVAKRLNANIDDISLRIEKKSLRAENLMGGK